MLHWDGPALHHPHVSFGGSMVPFSITPINLPSKDMITRCLAREAVWHAATDGVEEKGDVPFHSRQQMDCLRCKKCNWRNKWDLQLLRNNMAAVLLCTSVACCVLQRLEEICCYRAWSAHFSHQHPAACTKCQVKSLGSTHTALLLTSEGVLPTEPMERRVQKITHRMENCLLCKLHFSM